MDRVGVAKRRVPRKRIVDEPGGRVREIEVGDVIGRGNHMLLPYQPVADRTSVGRQRAPEECRQRFDLRDGLIRRIHDQQS